MKSRLLEGTVYHRRVRPFTYDLRHGVWYLGLDLAELDGVLRRFRSLRRNRAAVLSFRDRDHLVPPADDVPAAIAAHLDSEGFTTAGWTVELITSPRVLGYVFNPASFYLCRDAGGELEAVLVEVHNTYGERHLYTLRPARRSGSHVAAMAKDFFVSPFIDVSGGYVVRVYDHPAGVRIAIDHGDDDGPLLHTSLVLRSLPLTERNLVRLTLRYPLVTLKTIVLIHWHAFQLWRRGAGFRSHARHRRSQRQAAVSEGGLGPQAAR